MICAGVSGLATIPGAGAAMTVKAGLQSRMADFLSKTQIANSLAPAAVRTLSPSEVAQAQAQAAKLAAEAQFQAEFDRRAAAARNAPRTSQKASRSRSEIASYEKFEDYLPNDRTKIRFVEPRGKSKVIMEFEEAGMVQRIVVDMEGGYWRRAQVTEENGKKILHYLKADGTHHELENQVVPVTENGFLVDIRRPANPIPGVARAAELDRNINTIESEIKLSVERKDRNLLEKKLKSLQSEKRSIYSQHFKAINEAADEAKRLQRQFERDTHFRIPEQ